MRQFLLSHRFGVIGGIELLELFQKAFLVIAPVGEDAGAFASRGSAGLHHEVELMLGAGAIAAAAGAGDEVVAQLTA